MNLQDLAKELKTRGYEEIPTPDLIDVLREGMETLADMAVKNANDDFSLVVPKVGTFKTYLRKTKTARNPQTGEKIQIPERYVFRFKPSSLFSKQLAGVKIKGKAKAEKKNVKKAAKKEEPKKETKAKKAKK